MSKSSRYAGMLSVLLLLAWSMPLRAQTTGRIQGQVLDSQGATVPGATVTVTSPALQGAQTQVTDAEGRFRFLALPPGTYSAKVELASFQTVEQANIEVGLDRTVTLPITMQLAGVAATVNVEASSPVIDTQSTTIGINATAETFNRLPVQRDIYSIARLAPGATDDGVGPAVLGSTGAENQYIVEGLNTTGVERAEKGKQLNFDFVEEIEVKTGGLPAEYGRATGGVINVITKSGGNTFRGSLFGFSEGGGLQSNDNTANLRPATTTTVTDIDKPMGRRRRSRRLHRSRPSVVLWSVQPYVPEGPDRSHPHAPLAWESRDGPGDLRRYRSRPVCRKAHVPAVEQPDADGVDQWRSRPA